MGYKESYDQAKKDGEFTDLVPTFLEMRKKGDQVIGKYLGSAEMIGKLGSVPYFQYLFETDTGLVKFSLGAITDAEIRPSLKVGQVYAITFLEKQKIEKGREVNRFSVEHLPGVGESRVGGEDDTAF